MSVIQKHNFMVRITCDICKSDEEVEYIGAARGLVEKNKDAFYCMACNKSCAKAEIVE